MATLTPSATTSASHTRVSAAFLFIAGCAQAVGRPICGMDQLDLGAPLAVFAPTGCEGEVAAHGADPPETLAPRPSAAAGSSQLDLGPQLEDPSGGGALVGEPSGTQQAHGKGTARKWKQREKDLLEHARQAKKAKSQASRISGLEARLEQTESALAVVRSVPLRPRRCLGSPLKAESGD